MKKIFVSSKLIEYIEKEATIVNDAENYGWLIAYKKGTREIIHAPYSCVLYETRSSITATPEPIELSILRSIIPVSAYIGGIYHSHLTHVFHSAVDDMTLTQMMQMHPRAVSIVTNGSETKAYQSGGEIKIEYYEEKPNFDEITYHIPLTDKKNILEIMGRINGEYLRKFTKQDRRKAAKLLVSLPKDLSTSKDPDYLELKGFINLDAAGEDIFQLIETHLLELLSAIYNMPSPVSEIGQKTVFYFDIPLVFLTPLSQSVIDLIDRHVQRLLLLGYNEIANELKNVIE
ncbi:MAG: hypothetical protein QXL15_01115 [Candidatus Korarchaeota archaeon]